MTLLADEDFDYLSDAAQAAIRKGVERVERADNEGDGEAVIGAVKDFIESVAKTVIDALGLTYPSSPDLPALAKRTLVALELHPEGLQDRDALKRFSSSFITALNALADLRNRDGTGHGRAEPSDLDESHALFAMETAVSWAKWVLRAGRRVMEGRAAIDEAIVHVGSYAFRRTQLPAFLAEQRLTELGEEDQHRMGLAVGRRWNVGNFYNARDDVIEPMAEGKETYPAPFAAGVAEGLLIDYLGYVRTTANEVDLMVTIAMGLPDGLRQRTFSDLAEIVSQSDASYAFASTSRAAAVAQLRQHARSLVGTHTEIASDLLRIADRVEQF